MKPFHLPIAALALVLGACSRPERSVALSSGPAMPVRATVAVLERTPVLVEAPATVRPADRASIAAQLTGTIATFPPVLGQTVAVGEILVTLSASDTEARVRQAQAQLAEADRNATRQHTLVASGVNPPDALRDAEDRLRFAQATLAEAEAQLAFSTVRAPFAGVVTAKNALPGDLASPGVPLLVLESTQRLRAEGTVPEKAAATLRPADLIGVLLEDGGTPVAGKIEEMSAAADAVSRSVLVKVVLPPGTARSGQFARLQVATGVSDALMVPATAVTRFGQMERIFVVDQGLAVLRLVKTGRATGDRVEILSGLSPGESVVIAPPAALRDGQPVTVQL